MEDKEITSGTDETSPFKTLELRQQLPLDPPDMFGDIAAFHEKFLLTYYGKPRALPDDLYDFRMGFMGEELREYSTAMGTIFKELDAKVTPVPDQQIIAQSLALAGDALVDLVYVALGTAYLHGFDFNEMWRRVHMANMAKIRALRSEDSTRGSTYDVIKPKGWSPPDHSDLVEDNAHVPVDGIV